MAASFGGIPRSAGIIAVLLVLGVLALVLLGDRGGDEATLGGRIFDRDPRDIDGILMTLQGRQFRLDRSPDGVWSLGGDVTDHVQQNAVFELVRTIVLVQGGPLLPGTEPEDRRFEFNGPEAVRMTVFADDLEPVSLALGTTNPVNGLYYASGVGRAGCFQVPAEFRETLVRLPWDVMSRTLLPPVDRKRVTAVVLPRSDRTFEARFIDGLWWMAVPAEGPGYFGPEVASYQRLYADRRLDHDGRTWIRADADKMANLIHEVSTTIVRRILPPVEGEPLKGPWQLDPPWRSVILMGENINPDPTAADPHRLEIGFGPYLGEDGVPVLRRGNVLLTDVAAIATLELPVAEMAHRRALADNPLEADTFELRREGRVVLIGERTGQAATDEGREAWMTVKPAQVAEGSSEAMRHGYTRGLVVNLGRLPILAVLPEGTPAGLLEEREKVTITMGWGRGDEVRRTEYEMGFIDETSLPAQARLVQDPEGGRPVAIRLVETGQIFQVPGQIIVTARNLASYLADE